MSTTTVTANAYITSHSLPQLATALDKEPLGTSRTRMVFLLIAVAALTHSPIQEWVVGL